MRRLAPFLLALTTLRCATVAHGRYQRVPVTSDPSGAAVRVTCGAETQDGGVTPTTVRLRRGAEVCSLLLTHAGYADQTVTFRRQRSGWVWGNAAPGLVTGAVGAAGAALTAYVAEGNDATVTTSAAVGLLTGLAVPALIDHATGAMYRHVPERVEVRLTPK